LAVSVTDTMRNVRLKTFLLMIWFGALVLHWMVIGYLFGNVSLWMTIALVMALCKFGQVIGTPIR